MRGNHPFAGVPSELQERVDGRLAKEPEHPDLPVDFEQVHYDRRPFTLRGFVAPHWPALLGALALVVIETFAMQAGPKLMQVAIDRGLPGFGPDGHPGDFDVIVTVAILYLAAVVINFGASWARISWAGRVGEQLMFELRVRVFSHFQRLSLEYFSKEKAGRLMTRMTSDLNSLTSLFQEGMVQMAVQVFTMAIVTAVLFQMSAELALVTLLGVVPTMTVLTLWFTVASRRGHDRVREKIAEVMSHLQESLSAVRIVTAHNRQRQNIAEHHNVVGEHMEANHYTARVNAAYGAGTEVIGLAGRAFILLVGGRMVLSGSLTLGELAAFVLYLTAFFAPIQHLVTLYNTYQQGQAAVRKLRGLLGTEPSVPEAPDAQDLPPVRGEVGLEHVGFEYRPGSPVLTDVDLTIAAGETFSLVGATGAGKSTIAKLVARFYDPTSGRVTIDGHDLRDVTITSLRRQLGIVPQETFLFAGSIRDNLAFGRPDATDDEVQDACRAVGIDDVIERLPAGLDTPCHERGVSLSSGERQLLALARAFLARPRVLVLDEATSNLDLRSEAKIEHALDVVLGGRTAIIIAHRMATAMRADRIAVMHDGRVVELGTHDELVALGGRYAEMHAIWEAHSEGRASDASEAPTPHPHPSRVEATSQYRTARSRGGDPPGPVGERR